MINYWCEHRDQVFFVEDNSLYGELIVERVGEDEFLIDTQFAPTPQFPRYIQKKFDLHYKLSPEEFYNKFSYLDDISLEELLEA